MTRLILTHSCPKLIHPLVGSCGGQKQELQDILASGHGIVEWEWENWSEPLASREAQWLSTLKWRRGWWKKTGGGRGEENCREYDRRDVKIPSQ